MHPVTGPARAWLKQVRSNLGAHGVCRCRVSMHTRPPLLVGCPRRISFIAMAMPVAGVSKKWRIATVRKPFAPAWNREMAESRQIILTNPRQKTTGQSAVERRDIEIRCGDFATLPSRAPAIRSIATRCSRVNPSSGIRRRRPPLQRSVLRLLVIRLAQHSVSGHEPAVFLRDRHHAAGRQLSSFVLSRRSRSRGEPAVCGPGETARATTINWSCCILRLRRPF